VHSGRRITTDKIPRFLLLLRVPSASSFLSGYCMRSHVVKSDDSSSTMTGGRRPIFFLRRKWGGLKLQRALFVLVAIWLLATKKRKREIYPTIHHATDSNRAPPSPAASGMRQVSDPGHATAASSTSATSTLTPALQLPDVPVRRARTVPEHNVKADRAG
jgi:hypothetical protein